MIYFLIFYFGFIAAFSGFMIKEMIDDRREQHE